MFTTAKIARLLAKHTAYPIDRMELLTIEAVGVQKFQQQSVYAAVAGELTVLG